MSPLVILALVGVLAVAVAFTAMVHEHQERTAAHGLPRRIVRWHLGLAHHGQPVTDAGWHRPGRRALTATGHAGRFWYRPQKHRMAIRIAETEGPLLAAWGLLFYPIPTMAVMSAITLAGLGFGGWKIHKALHRRRHRKNWLFPLHKTLSPMLNIPLANKPESYLEVARDRSEAKVALPVSYRSQRQMQQLEEAVSAALGIEAPEVTWDRSGARPVVTFTHAITPPKVRLDDVRAEIEQAGPDDLVLGLGKRAAPVTVNLHGDSPHLGLSMGSGAGKSVTARFILAQALYKGGVGMVLDPKYISQSWVSAGRLPNCAVAKRTAEIHNALVWLGAELDRRNEVADASVDAEGNVTANVGPRILVVIEELNLLTPKLREYWQENGDGGPSPALKALAAVSAAGRQVRINLLMIAQRLSAAVTGGGDSRTNIGARILGRFDEPAWKMLASEFKMPPPNDTPGRVQVVTSKVAECQVAYLTGREAIDFAMSGVVTPCPSGMPGICGLPDPDPGVTEALPHALPAETSELTPESAELISLREACELGILPVSQAAAKTWRRRYRDFPQPVLHDGLTHRYDPQSLHEFAASRRK